MTQEDARGHYAIGKVNINLDLDFARKLADNCTGILCGLREKSKISFTTRSRPPVSTTVGELYYNVFCVHSLYEQTRDAGRKIPSITSPVDITPSIKKLWICVWILSAMWPITVLVSKGS